MAALLVAALAGCGSDQNGDTDAEAGPAPGGGDVEQVVIGVPTKVTTVDPNLAINEVDVMALALVGGTLTRPVGDGERVAPSLARRCAWTKGLTRYECTLRDGLRFSDGSPITAGDVVASFRRGMDDDANVNGGLYAPLEQVRAEGDRRVVLSLKRPYASLPVVLTEGPFAVFPASGLAKGEAFFRDPVVSGPYTVSGVGSDTARFDRNPEYGGPAPIVDTVEFRSIGDPNARLLQLKSGQLDIAHGLPPTLADQVTGDAEAITVRQYGGLYVYMNTRRGPLSDPRIRKAIAAAVDRDQLNSVGFGGDNRPLGSFFPSNMLGHDPNAPTERDLDRARELLRGTECENGCTIGLMVREGFSPYAEMSVVVKENLADIGIDVELEQADQSVTSQREQDGEFEMEVSGLYDVANVPDAVMLNYGLDFDGGIESLFSGYDSAEMDAAIEEVSATTGDARVQVLAEVERIFQRDMPYVPILDFATVIGSRIDPDVVTLGASGVYEVGTRQGD